MHRGIARLEIQVGPAQQPDRSDPMTRLVHHKQEESALRSNLPRSATQLFVGLRQQNRATNAGFFWVWQSLKRAAVEKPSVAIIAGLSRPVEYCSHEF